MRWDSVSDIELGLIFSDSIEVGKTVGHFLRTEAHFFVGLPHLHRVLSVTGLVRRPLEGNLKQRWWTPSRGSSLGQGCNDRFSCYAKVGDNRSAVHRMNLSGADMGKGEQLNISVEMPSSKIHGCDFRSTGRQRRLVCITLFAALLPFVITRSYFSFISSDVPSEATSFFEEHPPPATHFDKPQRVCLAYPVVSLVMTSELLRLISRMATGFYLFLNL